MKNLLKFSLAIFILTFTLYSCSDDDTAKTAPQMTEAESLAFFKENMSIFDARVRSLNENTFVKELYLANFSDKSWDRNQIGFDNIVFQDNGKGNDLIANDGIFTSVEKFNFNEKVKYQEGMETLSVMDVYITDPEFKHSKEFNKLRAEYKIKKKPNLNGNLSAKFKAQLTCDVEICSSGCIADWIWDGFGCICVSNCSVTIGWG